MNDDLKSWLIASLFILGIIPTWPEAAQASTCAISQANWDINVKGGDPTVKAKIGTPTSSILAVGDNVGCFRDHQHGTLYWHPTVGTQFVMGAIRVKYNAHLGARGLLRYPTTDETATPDSAGRFNHFQGGSIYWHPNVGAFEVHGDIRALWSQMGWERSVLRYPITDETKTPDSIGRFNHFQGGSIYWKPNLGPHFIMGAIRHHWANSGWERNPKLGYPITNELPAKTGSENRFNDFENGVVYWQKSTGRTHELFSFPPASRARADLEIEAQTQVNALLAPHGRKVYVDRALTIAQVHDYTRRGFNEVVNREVELHLRIKYKAEFLGIDVLLPDPHTDLRLFLRIEKRSQPGGTDIIFTLTRYAAHTHVPAPTSAVISAEMINRRLRDEVMNGVVGQPRLIGTIPSSLNVLSVKVMPSGDLNTYVEPL